MIGTEMVFTIHTDISEKDKQDRTGIKLVVPNEIVNNITIVSEKDKDRFLTESKLILVEAYEKLNQLVIDCGIAKIPNTPTTNTVQ